MPGLDHIQTEKARGKRLMVLNLARHKCIRAGCMGSFHIAAARAADQRNARNGGNRIAAYAYGCAKPLCDKRGESAERFGNVYAAHANSAEVFRREGSGVENAERIRQTIVHAAGRSIKVCVGGILRDAVA